MSDEQQNRPRRRTTRRFAWEAVDHALLRKLLIALYEARDQSLETAELRRLRPDLLPQNACRALGRLPAPKHMRTLAPVLRTAWLPKATAKQVIELAVIVQAGSSRSEHEDSIATKADAIRFLRQRRLTHNYLTNLRNAFIAAHKTEQDALITSTPQAHHAPVTLRGENEPHLYAPYEHQRVCWRALDKAVGSRRKTVPAGLIVFPTGAGKTATAVEWLLDRLSEDRAARVLWIAHQQELLVQAQEQFA